MGLLYRQGLVWVLGEAVVVMLEVEVGAAVAVTAERSWWAQLSLSPQRCFVANKIKKERQDDRSSKAHRMPLQRSDPAIQSP